MTDKLRLDIDLLKLEEEWSNQPALFHYWAKKAADAELVFNESKSNLDLVAAETDKMIRDDPESYDLPKVTEKTVEGAVILHPKYQKAVKRVNEARHAFSIANAAVEALEHRKRALTMAVELWVRDYYSEPHARPTSDEGRDAERHMVRSRGRRRVEREADNDE